MRGVLSTRDGEYIQCFHYHGNKNKDKKLEISNNPELHGPAAADIWEDREKVGETDPRIRM